MQLLANTLLAIKARDGAPATSDRKSTSGSAKAKGPQLVNIRSDESSSFPLAPRAISPAGQDGATCRWQLAERELPGGSGLENTVGQSVAGYASRLLSPPRRSQPDAGRLSHGHW